jgi:hypothetical protein
MRKLAEKIQADQPGGPIPGFELFIASILVRINDALSSSS